MKKLITMIVLFTFCITLGGCGKNSKKTTWEMQSIQGKDGKVIYCSDENKDIYKEATVKNISAVLEDSSISITNKNTGEKWIGKCKKLDSSQSDTVIYEVIFDDDIKGHIGKSITKYADNTQIDTLIVSCNEYALNFFESTDIVD